LVDFWKKFIHHNSKEILRFFAFPECCPNESGDICISLIITQSLLILGEENTAGGKNG
jgi:hypothetical protein